MKRFILLIVVTTIIVFICGLFTISSIMIITSSSIEAQSSNYESLEITDGVKSNDLYADRYRKLLMIHLKKDGYVTLERLVYYLQRTRNILDVSILSDEDWEEAYMENIDEELKQMMPIKSFCIKLKEKELPEYTIQNGKNKDGREIDRIDLCNVNNIDIATSSSYSEIPINLPYTSPFSIETNYYLTSIVFEQRNVEFDISASQQQHINYHNGWDLGVPIGTEVRSICDGVITNITMTQNNDLPFSQSKNLYGNYVYVECNNGYIAQYLHIKYNSVYGDKQIGSTVMKGEPLLKTSTTGLSTGPHLHLGLKTKDGKPLDAFSYIDFSN